MAAELMPMQPLLVVTRYAEAIMATKYIAVKLGTADNQVNIAGADETVFGILLDTAAAVGDQVRVGVIGIVWGSANGAFSKGDFVGSAAADGQLDTVADKKYAVGMALAAATAANDLVPILLTPGSNATA